MHSAGVQKERKTRTRPSLNPQLVYTSRACIVTLQERSSSGEEDVEGEVTPEPENAESEEEGEQKPASAEVLR